MPPAARDAAETSDGRNRHGEREFINTPRRRPEFRSVEVTGGGVGRVDWMSRFGVCHDRRSRRLTAPDRFCP